jgi:phospholipid-translocating ATPase
MAMLLFSNSTFTHIVSITFTALVLTEWLNIGTEVSTWHKYMVLAEAGSVACYTLSFFLLREYFDLSYIFSFQFLWRVGVVTAVSWGPVHLINKISSIISPSEVDKVRRESING